MPLQPRLGLLALVLLGGISYAQDFGPLAPEAETFVLPERKLSPRQSEEELMSILERYPGRWVGKYEVRNLRGQVLQSLDIEQSYTWDDVDGQRILRGSAVIASEGELAYSTSFIHIDGGHIYAQITRNDINKGYVARPSEDLKQINWIELDSPNLLGKKHSESIVQREDGSYLVIEGYEEVNMGNSTTVFIISSEMKKQPDES